MPCRLPADKARAVQRILVDAPKLRFDTGELDNDGEPILDTRPNTIADAIGHWNDLMDAAGPRNIIDVIAQRQPRRLCDHDQEFALHFHADCPQFELGFEPSDAAASSFKQQPDLVGAAV